MTEIWGLRRDHFSLTPRPLLRLSPPPGKSPATDQSLFLGSPSPSSLAARFHPRGTFRANNAREVMLQWL
jgi:hypothetical protein